MKYRYLSSLLLSTLVVTLTITSLLGLNLSTQTAFAEVRTPIHIVGDTYFTLDNGVNGGGSGTAEDPYIIENWEINASGAHGIWIENTTAYFVVRNCVVENGRKTYRGIYLENVVNGSIVNNTCNYDNYGIYMNNSFYNNLSGNTFRYDNVGIYLYSSCKYNNLDSNTFSFDNYGIYLFTASCDNNDLTNNTCGNGSYGIYLKASTENLTGNRVENYLYGIYMNPSGYDNLINNTCSYNRYGIYITGATSIYNNLTGNTCNNENYYGIYLTSTSNYNTLTNNTCSNNVQSGIIASSSSYENMTGNICENNQQYGINLSGSTYDNLTNNTCRNNSLYGYYLTSSSNYNNFIGNTSSNDNYGFYLVSSTYDNLINNICENSNYGIYFNLATYNNMTANIVRNNSQGIYVFNNSSYTTMTGNTMENNLYNFGVQGSTVAGLDHTIDNSNLINGKPMCYLKDKSYIVIGSDNNIGFLGLVRCNNIVVENLVLEPNGLGAVLVSTTNSSIKNCVLSNNSSGGIYMYSSCNYDNLIGNICENNSAGGYGIYLYTTCNYNNLIGNTCSNARYGIWLSSSTYDNLIGNTINNNNYSSVFLQSSSNNNRVENNICVNDNLGMYLNSSSTLTVIGNTCSNSDRGIYFATSNTNNVTGNTIENNRLGLYFAPGSSNTIVANSIRNNRNGVWMPTTSSTGNVFHHNNFWYNDNQAFDNSTNTWDNGTAGNYWSDYTGRDDNGDGIGDTPENIPPKTNKDRYPLMNPYGGLVCGVDVTIENALLESYPSQVLEYTIDVYNLGTVADNFSLSVIPDGWPDITLDNLLENVLPYHHRQATMFVHVPDNALECTYKEFTVVAESQFCGATDNDIALAHVIPIPLCLLNVTIENKLLEGYPSQVLAYTIDVVNRSYYVDNFNLSYIPDGWPDITFDPQVLENVMPSENRQTTMLVHVPDGAIGCTYKVITVVAESQKCGATDNDNATAHVKEFCGVDVKIENALLEGHPSQVLAYTIDVHNSGDITDNINLSYIPDGWPDITIVPQVLTGVLPNENRQATMLVHVPDYTPPCTYKDIIVVAESQFCHATDNDTAQAHVTELCGVDVTIENTLLKGVRSQVLEYTIDVHNSGNVVDNINLSYIPDGWPDITIDQLVLTDVMPNENRQATMFVHVPDNASPSTYKEITVVAESQFCGATDNDTAQAYVAVCGVDVTIENTLLVGYPSLVLEYTIDVHNSGNITDNIGLSCIPDGWPDITIVPQVFINVLPSENRQATMFVHVPDNASPCAYKDITVVAESEFCGATDNDTAQALVTVAPLVTYTYVSSYSAVKGTVINFANQQSADDGGAYSTLAERPLPGPLNFTEGFENAGAFPAGWTQTGSWGIKTNKVRTGTYSMGVTGAAGSTNYLYSARFDFTGRSNVHLTYYSYASAAAASSTLTVDASIDGGSTWTVPVQASTTPGNGTWKTHTETYDISSLAGKSNVKFRWTMVKQGATSAYCVIDDITWTASGTLGNDMEIYENITDIPSADTQTLQLRYELANTNDTFNVQVWDGSTWNTRGSTLNSTSWTNWSYTLLSSEVISGTVQVKFVDVNPNSTPQDNILKDYLRVKSETAAQWGVDVTIENALLGGIPSQILEYTIDVYNSGNIMDNISLSYIPDGWPDITIVPLVLTDVMPSEHRQATMFVHIPEGALPDTYKEITVVAESQFCGATDNATTEAHVNEPTQVNNVNKGTWYYTIQAAVNAADNGDTIVAYPWIFHENVLIQKSITLTGTDKNAVIIDGTGLSQAGITNSGTWGTVTWENLVISNLTIRGFNLGVGCAISLAHVGNVTMENLIFENDDSGIVLFGSCDNNIVRNNVFENCPGNAIAINGSNSSPGAKYNVIEGNTITNCGTGYTPTGVSVICVFSWASWNTIENNTLIGTSNLGTGIALWGTTANAAIDTPENNNTIVNNTISGLYNGIRIVGNSARLQNLVENTTIVGNTLTSNTYGVNVKGFTDNVIGGVHFNSIVGNQIYGIYDNSPATLNATCNWWGDASGPGGAGPGTGDNITENVRYSPWLGFTVGTAPMTFHVDNTGTIQSAVDAASSGDTIIAHPGTFHENVLIQKSITLTGTDKNAVIIDGTGLSQAGITNSGTWGTVTWENLVISNLTIRGFNLGVGCAISLAHVGNVTMENLIFENDDSGIVLFGSCDNDIVRNNVFENCPGNAIAIYGSNSSPGAKYNVIEGNTITNCGTGYGGVAVICAFSWASWNTIENNTMIGTLNTGYGVQMWGTTANGSMDTPENNNTIVNNTISNFLVGIYIVGNSSRKLNLVENTTILRNTLTSNTYGVKIRGFNDNVIGSAHFNTIVGNQIYGIYDNSSATLNATCNWWGDASGPYNPTTNPSGLGDNVSDNVTYAGWARAPIGTVWTGISPTNNSGANGATLNYTVTVQNTDDVSHTFDLTDNASPSWLPSLSPASLTVAPNEDNTATFSVIVPSDVIGGTIYNMTVTATSQDNAAVNASGNCTAEVNVARSISVSIAPPSQSGANGVTLNYTVTVTNTGNVSDTYTLDNTDNQGWVKSISNTAIGPLAPFGGSDSSTILRVTIPENAIGGTIDNMIVTATSEDNAAVNASGNCTAEVNVAGSVVSVSIAPPSQSGANGVTLNYTVTVTNTGNVSETYTLDNTDTLGWVKSLSNTSVGPLAPFGGSDSSTILSVTIPSNAIGGTVDNMVRVTATSQDNAEVNASGNCTAEVNVARSVSVSISPPSQSGPIGATLTYTVTVSNTGNVPDIYTLENTDTLGWTKSLNNTSVAVPAFSSDSTTTLSVTIPLGVVGIENVTVTANGTGDIASASCLAELTCSLQLFTGWNLVCFPVDNSPTTSNRIFTGLTYLTDYVIYRWSAPGGPYVLVGATENLMDNTGYWVWINTDKTLKWSGNQPTSRDVHLVPGWNMVGFPIDNASSAPNNKFYGLTYFTNYVIYSWTAPGGPYVLQSTWTPFKDNTGYWVWIDQPWTVTVP